MRKIEVNICEYIILLMGCLLVGIGTGSVCVGLGILWTMVALTKLVTMRGDTDD